MIADLHSALETDPMILDERFGTAIVAEDPCLGIPELRRHRLSLDIEIVPSESNFHVYHALAAYRALERVLHVFLPACVMDAVPTSHEYDGLRRGKHVLPTNGAITICRSLDAFVRVFDAHGNASTTRLSPLALKEVFS